MTINVAEVKSAIHAAVAEVQDGQQAVQLANEKLDAAQQNLALAVEGSGAEAVQTAQAALVAARDDLDNCLATTIGAVEQAQTYLSSL